MELSGSIIELFIRNKGIDCPNVAIPITKAVQGSAPDGKKYHTLRLFFSAYFPKYIAPENFRTQYCTIWQQIGQLWLAENICVIKGKMFEKL